MAISVEPAIVDVRYQVIPGTVTTAARTGKVTLKTRQQYVITITDRSTPS